MKSTQPLRVALKVCSPLFGKLPGIALFLIVLCFSFTSHAQMVTLRVMKQGLGAGLIRSNPAGIVCNTGCTAPFSVGTSVVLRAEIPGMTGGRFRKWEGDVRPADTAANPLTITISGNMTIRAIFDLDTVIPTLTPAQMTPGGIDSFLRRNPAVRTPARFVQALPPEYKQNWILMTRSESLQTGTAQYPRVLLPSRDGKLVFTIGLVTHNSFPGSHPNAVEFMQWDGVAKNFRFHEIVLDSIAPRDVFGGRSRAVAIDDAKCSKCHSTRNVLNRDSPFIGTTGIPPRAYPYEVVKSKNKPNWDTYDSWAGMLAFNRDRIYKGSVEAAAFRYLFNLWNWRDVAPIRELFEQLQLQADGVRDEDTIKRIVGGPNDGRIRFGFDYPIPLVLREPRPSSSGTGLDTTTFTNYLFDRIVGTGDTTRIIRGDAFVTLHHTDIPGSDEGRGVHLFDLLGGLSGNPDGNLNSQRVADEINSHRWATGSFPIDVRPIALAITKSALSAPDLMRISGGNITINGAALPAALVRFLNARNGLNITQLVTDTRNRAYSFPRRKADIQKMNLDRTTMASDPYITRGDMVPGLLQRYGDSVDNSGDPLIKRIRQEVFRRSYDPRLGFHDRTPQMRGLYTDREDASNIEPVALFRYFLEPLGVSVDKWTMGVRGRSRTYTFADVFGNYINTFEREIKASLRRDAFIDPSTGMPFAFDPDDTAQLRDAIFRSLSLLPDTGDVPKYTDIQRIFNKSCIECHGGLNYPPYRNYGNFVDLSEQEHPPGGDTDRLYRSYQVALALTTTDPFTSTLFRRINMPDTAEDCPFGLMPCGGPKLSQADIETIRRWIQARPMSRPFTYGDPHIKTVDGTNYDFQAAGEFVLLRGDYLEIQTRHTPVTTAGPLGPNEHTGVTSCVSLNTAVAIRIGAHRITYEPDLSGKPNPEGMQLRIDGKLVKLSPQGIAFAASSRIMPTQAPGGIQVRGAGGTSIIVTPAWWDHYKVWYLNIDIEHARASEGLMGAIAPGNWLPALPDGRWLGRKPADVNTCYRDLYEVFGNAWRVNDTTTLFDYAPGTSTRTFLYEGWPGVGPNGSCIVPVTASTKPLPAIARGKAEQVCADVKDADRKLACVLDVMVTGDESFAKTYLLTDKIASNKPPKAPVLTFPKDFDTLLSPSITFKWDKTTDEDGDALTYKFYMWPVNDFPDNNQATEITSGKFGGGGNRTCVWIVVLAGLLVLIILFFTKKKRTVLVIAAIIVLIAIIIAYFFCGGKTISKTAELKSGQAYFWKVIVEDGKGAVVESETRRVYVK